MGGQAGDDREGGGGPVGTTKAQVVASAVYGDCWPGLLALVQQCEGILGEVGLALYGGAWNAGTEEKKEKHFPRENVVADLAGFPFLLEQRRRVLDAGRIRLWNVSFRKKWREVRVGRVP